MSKAGWHYSFLFSFEFVILVLVAYGIDFWGADIHPIVHSLHMRHKNVASLTVMSTLGLTFFILTSHMLFFSAEYRAKFLQGSVAHGNGLCAEQNHPNQSHHVHFKLFTLAVLHSCCIFWNESHQWL